MSEAEKPPENPPKAPGTGSAYYKPKRVRTRHEYMLHLAALGYSNVEISERSGLHAGYISRMLNHPAFLKRVDQIRKEIFANDPDAELRTMIPQSLQVIRAVLNNPQAKDSLRVDTAFRLFERTNGRATQRVEIEGGSTIKELFKRLDSLEGQGLIETKGEVVEDAIMATEADGVLKTPQDDEFDRWLEELDGKEKD